MALKWWQSAVFYVVYLRSFADGNGDGIGDFAGLTEKLDYFQKLGVDALWLTPHFPSPNWDWGYDVSDYCNIGPEYGDLAAFKRFLDEAHARGLHVILDLVLNHTSHKHPWFIESKSSRDNPKADWYVWVDTPPNNWQSCFDGDAWTYEPQRGQYYYHFFMKQQPDLNWRNPEVKQAMWQVVRFWLDLGVDGFRLDAVGALFEDPAWTPQPVPLTLAELRYAAQTAQTPAQKRRVGKYWSEIFKHQWGDPELHNVLRELRTILDEYPGDRMLVGEDDNIECMGNGNDELHMVFNFPLMRVDGPLTPAHIRNNQRQRLAQLAKLPFGGWPCNTLGNHDTSRLYTRFSDGKHSAELARLNAAMLLTLRGTPFLYYGDEIGMTDHLIEDPAQLRDTMALWYHERLIEQFGVPPQDAARYAVRESRDKCRTPMQWSAAPNAGFCPPGVIPWLPVNPNYKEGGNVADQENDPYSLLNFYRRLLRLRKAFPALIEGDYVELLPRHKEILAYLRAGETQRILVLLNYSERPQPVHLLPALATRRLKTIFSSAGRAGYEEHPRHLTLAPFEVYLAELT